LSFLAKVLRQITDWFSMERGSLQLINFIIFIGLLVTIATTVALPMMTWDSEVAPDKVKETQDRGEMKPPKRLTFNYK